jgi:Ion channel
VWQHYRNWNLERLYSTDISFHDGFWFAYISTTSVGLGDYILEPAVIREIDMLSWPYLFLLGFVLLSAFLCSLSSIVMKPMHEFTTKLAKRLDKTNMMFGSPIKAREDTDGDNITHIYESGGRVNCEQLPSNSSDVQ